MTAIEMVRGVFERQALRTVYLYLADMESKNQLVVFKNEWENLQFVLEESDVKL